MAYGGDDRDLRGVDSPGYPLVIKGPQILDGSAAPAHDQYIRQLPAIGVANGAHDLRRCFHTLHPHRQQQHLGNGIAPPQDTDHIVYRGARR